MSRHNALFIFYNNKFVEAVLYVEGKIPERALEKFPVGSVAVKLMDGGKYYYWLKERIPEDESEFNRGWRCKQANCTLDKLPLTGEALSYLLIL